LEYGALTTDVDVPVELTGMANVNAACLRATFSSWSRLRIPRRFSFSATAPYDLDSRASIFSSS
jgi:hypothetical protein